MSAHHDRSAKHARIGQRFLETVAAVGTMAYGQALRLFEGHAE